MSRLLKRPLHAETRRRGTDLSRNFVSVAPLDLSQLKVLPLAMRKSLTRADDILVDPDSPAPPVAPAIAARIAECAERIRAARRQGSSVMLIYGAHLLRNGTARILERLMAGGWTRACGNQRRRHDPRLGIRVARRVERKCRENVANGHIRHVG